MKRDLPTEADLKHELNDLRDRYPKLADDNLFIFWFLRAFITESESEAAAALCGGAGDKSIDAVLVDDSAKTVVLIQGKYRRGIGEKVEARADIVAFASAGVSLCSEKASFSAMFKNTQGDLFHRLEAARAAIRTRNYRLQMYFLTTGRVTPGQEEDARHVAKGVDCECTFDAFQGKEVLQLLADWIDGVAPPVPSLDLPLESGDGVQVKSVLQRTDSHTGIESWVFSVTDLTIADIFGRVGTRIFARNVRGFLGNTEINQGMEDTIEKDSRHFWYYNNGITIICDRARRELEGGRDVLRVKNPQIINGQQTTRTLARSATKHARASVLVRVISVQRDDSPDSKDFESLVSQIVACTNWQNAIRQSDLMANDRRQIEIERQLRKLGYGYIRKRQTKGEAWRAIGAKTTALIKKEELAQAVAACDLDPVVVRKGKEHLFEEKWYGHVFPNSDPFYYLMRYALMTEVKFAASGHPERAYAKWVVLNFMWSQFSPCVRARAGQEAFRHEWERQRKPLLRVLWQANDTVYKAAIAFFRAKRGKGDTAADVSSFFQQKGLHKKFLRYWGSAANARRNVYRKIWSRFKRLLREKY